MLKTHAWADFHKRHKSTAALHFGLRCCRLKLSLGISWLENDCWAWITFWLWVMLIRGRKTNWKFRWCSSSSKLFLVFISICAAFHAKIRINEIFPFSLFAFHSKKQQKHIFGNLNFPRRKKIIIFAILPNKAKWKEEKKIKLCSHIISRRAKREANPYVPLKNKSKCSLSVSM